MIFLRPLLRILYVIHIQQLFYFSNIRYPNVKLKTKKISPHFCVRMLGEKIQIEFTADKHTIFSVKLSEIKKEGLISWSKSHYFFFQKLVFERNKYQISENAVILSVC